MSKKSTTDIYLAASFLALGAILENVNKSDPRHMVFELEYPHTVDIPSDLVVSNNMDSWENQYGNGVLMVNAVQFKDALQRLKSIVHTR